MLAARGMSAQLWCEFCNASPSVGSDLSRPGHESQRCASLPISSQMNSLICVIESASRAAEEYAEWGYEAYSINRFLHDLVGT